MRHTDKKKDTGTAARKMRHFMYQKDLFQKRQNLTYARLGKAGSGSATQSRSVRYPNPH
jgi:hypothetical protein